MCGQLATVCVLISQGINQQKELSPECFNLAFNCQLRALRNYTLDFLLIRFAKSTHFAYYLFDLCVYLKLSLSNRTYGTFCNLSCFTLSTYVRTYVCVYGSYTAHFFPLPTHLIIVILIHWKTSRMFLTTYSVLNKSFYVISRLCLFKY